MAAIFLIQFYIRIALAIDAACRSFLFLPYRFVLFIAILLTSCCSTSANDPEYDLLLSEFTEKTVPIEQKEGTVFFQERKQLEREEFIHAVLDRNPSVASAQQAWQASIYRYPQAIALDDPILSYSFSPGSIGNKTFNNMPLRYGQTVELSQKFSFPGKRFLQGSLILADVHKMQSDFEEIKLELALSASILFDDYYLTQKAIEINNYHLELLTESKYSAESLYVTGAIGEQDWLQIGLEIDQILAEKSGLESQQKIVLAKINGLLHQTPEIALPPPPKQLSIPVIDLNNKENLEDEAIQCRPDLESIRAQIEGSKAAIELTELQYFPDFDIKASYDSQWDQPQYRRQLGISMNIPFIQLEKRQSAIREALLNKTRLENEYIRLLDTLRVEIEEALQGITQNQRIVQLWEESGLPLAREKLASAMFNFESGQGSLMTALEANRNVRTIELRLYSALAEAWKYKAQLDRVVGRIPNFPQPLSKE